MGDYFRHQIDAVRYGLDYDRRFFINKETAMTATNPDKKWIVMHEDGDKPVSTGTGSVVYFNNADAAIREAERLTEIDGRGASYYVLARVAKVSPVAKTKTVAL